MNSRLMVGVLAWGLSLGASVAWSQGQIYRCGNTYTNDPVDAKNRGCRLLDGGAVTIVQGRDAGKGDGTGQRATASAVRSQGARSEAERVDSAAQRARDSDARDILHTELRRAEERLTELQQEYNQGQPTRLASERGQPQRYDERVADLKSRIERAQADVAGIQRELDRLGARGR